MQRDSTKTVLRLGFAAILGLIFVVAIISLTVLHSSNHRVETLVTANNTKTALINTMRSAARDRTLALQNMILLEDPFKQDDEWMNINAFGSTFAAARLALLEMPLTERERALLDEQAKLTAVVGELQLFIAELVRDGQKARALKLLLEEAIPGQNRVFLSLSQLLSIQESAGAQTVESAKRDYRNTFISILLLMIGIAGLSILIARFVTRRSEETEQSLYDATEHAHVTLHSIGDGVITTGVNGAVEHINAEAERLTGWTLREAAGQHVDTVFVALLDVDSGTVVDPVDLAVQERKVITSEGDVLLRHRSGHKYAIEYTASPIFDPTHEQVRGAILVFRDVTQVRTIAKELAYQAKHDMLTGLMNRREFEHHLEAALGRIPTHTDEPHWLCYLDLDQFKLINDTCGHLAGDELLKQIARTLQLQIREADLLARLGGDEFALLLNRCSAEAAVHIIERVRQAVMSMRFVWGNKAFNTSASFGLVPITPDNGSLYELMSSADTACYVAKDGGRNRIHLYEAGDDATARRTGEMHWVHRIKQALEDNRFIIYHQPIVPLQGRVYSIHSEILVRMLDEDGSIIPPMAFIPAAERYNLMADIDRWVIENSFRMLRHNVLAAAPGSTTIAINLSAQSLCDDAFLPFVLRQLDEHAFDPHHLCFEITETCAISNLSRAIHFITTLRARGCRFALDDFGSGLSSFGYLKNLPVEYLKIDGSFVRDIEVDAMDLALVDSINQIGHVAGIQTIAEYVENQVIREKLRRLGVDYAQGYGIARPEPINFLIGGGRTAQARGD